MENSTIYVILLSAAGAFILVLFTALGFLIKDRLKLRAKLDDEQKCYERKLLLAKERSNQEHIQSIEQRLGFGSERFTKLEELTVALKDMLVKNRLDFTEMLETMHRSLVNLTTEFVSKNGYKEYRIEIKESFKKLETEVKELKEGQHRMDTKLEGMQLSVRTLSDQLSSRTSL